MRKIFVFVGLIVLVVASIALATYQATRLEILVIVMLGQSNPVGHSRNPNTELSHPDVLVYSRDGHVRQAAEPLDLIGGGSGGGWGTVMGLGLIRPGRRVLLVPRAINGSPMSRWDPSGETFAEVSSQVDDAMREARKLGRARMVIVWDQGESDSWAREKAVMWRLHFVELVNAWRKRWPNTPVLFVETGQPQGEMAQKLVAWPELHASQTRVTLPRCKSVSALDLPMEPDGVHRTWGAQLVVGKRLAEEASKLLQ